MKFYLQIQPDGTITDAITYPYANYVEYIADTLPNGVYGGWFKLENGTIVEYPELKPISPEDEIETLKTQNEVLGQTLANITLQNADLTVQMQTLSKTVAEMQLGGI